MYETCEFKTQNEQKKRDIILTNINSFNHIVQFIFNK